MNQEEFEFELAKKHTEALLLIAKELCNIRQVLEDIAESSNIMRQAAITGFHAPNAIDRGAKGLRERKTQ